MFALQRGEESERESPRESHQGPMTGLFEGRGGAPMAPRRSSLPCSTRIWTVRALSCASTACRRWRKERDM